MSDPFDKFEQRALALRPARALAEDEADDRELDALFECFLGLRYDRARIERVRTERRRARKALAEIAARLGRRNAEEVAALANEVMTDSLARVRAILGDEDFERLFGKEGLGPVTLIDPATLAREAAETRAPPVKVAARRTRPRTKKPAAKRPTKK